MWKVSSIVLLLSLISTSSALLKLAENFKTEYNKIKDAIASPDGYEIEMKIPALSAVCTLRLSVSDFLSLSARTMSITPVDALLNMLQRLISCEKMTTGQPLTNAQVASYISQHPTEDIIFDDVSKVTKNSANKAQSNIITLFSVSALILILIIAN